MDFCTPALLPLGSGRMAEPLYPGIHLSCVVQMSAHLCLVSVTLPWWLLLLLCLRDPVIPVSCCYILVTPSALVAAIMSW
jgi:hypothetical protein